MKALSLVNETPRSEDLGFRDAIHIPIIVMNLIQEEKPKRWGHSAYFQPGEGVILVPGTKDTVVTSNSIDHGMERLGIINPYMTWEQTRELQDICTRQGSVPVTIFLQPGISTGVTHNYIHPVLDAPEKEKNPHLEWLELFCVRNGFLLKEVLQTVSYGEGYIVARGYDLHSAEELGEDYEPFWFHVTRYLKVKDTPELREKIGWSCSC